MSEEHITTKIYLTDHTILNFLIIFYFYFFIFCILSDTSFSTISLALSNKGEY